MHRDRPAPAFKSRRRGARGAQDGRRGGPRAPAQGRPTAGARAEAAKSVQSMLSGCSCRGGGAPLKRRKAVGEYATGCAEACRPESAMRGRAAASYSPPSRLCTRRWREGGCRRPTPTVGRALRRVGMAAAEWAEALAAGADPGAAWGIAAGRAYGVAGGRAIASAGLLVGTGAVALGQPDHKCVSAGSAPGLGRPGQGTESGPKQKGVGQAGAGLKPEGREQSPSCDPG